MDTLFQIGKMNSPRAETSVTHGEVKAEIALAMKRGGRRWGAPVAIVQCDGRGDHCGSISSRSHLAPNGNDVGEHAWAIA